ncbi:hypothetical protein [Methylogaea oryzae]|uniref:hypothetical protein n=1 Tax=Methylogaea oryzae TaxID=1295382 RepID=UPI0006D20386|nr:hypothetical protein [Methylogaea oryzae]
MKIVALILLAASLSGCAGQSAIGQKYNYAGASLTLPYTGAPLVVGVQDRRPYIVSHNKSPDFVGLQRAAVGIPYDIHTASGAPLADDMAKTLAGALRGATPVSIGSNLSRADAIRTLHADGKRAVLLTLNEWRSDAYVGATLHYDMEMEALGADGHTLASARIHGSEAVDDTAPHPTGYPGFNAPSAVPRHLEALFGRFHRR